MSESYAWTESRLRAIELFSDAPSAALEQRVLDVFLEHPSLVVEAIEHVGRRFERGQVRSPWAVLAKHVEEAVRPLDSPVVSDERDREKAIRRAEAWIRAAGKHFDQVEEILLELFDSRGLLAGFDSPELRERVAGVYREARPEGLLIDEQAEMRARAYRGLSGEVPGANGPVTPPPWRRPKREPEPSLDPEPVLG